MKTEEIPITFTASNGGIEILRKEVKMTNQTVVDFERHEYEELCIEMRELLREEKEMAAKKSELRKRLVEMAGGERMEYGIKVTERNAVGSVDYKKIVGDHLDIDDEMRDSYRKPTRNYWEVRSY